MCGLCRCPYLYNPNPYFQVSRLTGFTVVSNLASYVYEHQIFMLKSLLIFKLVTMVMNVPKDKLSFEGWLLN